MDAPLGAKPLTTPERPSYHNNNKSRLAISKAVVTKANINQRLTWPEDSCQVLHLLDGGGLVETSADERNALRILLAQNRAIKHARSKLAPRFLQ